MSYLSVSSDFKTLINKQKSILDLESISSFGIPLLGFILYWASDFIKDFLWEQLAFSCRIIIVGVIMLIFKELIKERRRKKLKRSPVLHYIEESLKIKPQETETVKKFRLSRLRRFEHYDNGAAIKVDLYALKMDHITDCLKMYIYTFSRVMDEIKRELSYSNVMRQHTLKEIQDIICKYMTYVDKCHEPDGVFSIYSIYPVEIISIDRLQRAYELIMKLNVDRHKIGFLERMRAACDSLLKRRFDENLEIDSNICNRLLLLQKFDKDYRLNSN